MLEVEDEEISTLPYYNKNENYVKNSMQNNQALSKSHLIETENFGKMDEMEKIFNEGIRKNSEFDILMNDPRLVDLLGNLNIEK